MRRPTTTPLGGGPLLVAVVLLVGYAAGRVSVGEPADAAAPIPSPAATPALLATATRTAELIALASLRTQVARPPSPVFCTPEPVTATVVPSPTVLPTPVPPVAAGTALPYAGGWTVTVTGISLVPTFANLTATGIYARVDLRITNGDDTPRAFPYSELILLDAQGRIFLPDPLVAAQSEAGAFHPFPPSLPTPAFVVFHVATDATGPFVLGSTADPTFRVHVELEQRG